MTAETSKVTIHMVTSVDGFIAKKDNSVEWFETADFYDKGLDEPNEENISKEIDCFVMGYRTYEHAVELSKNYGWVYGDVPTIVVTHRDLSVEKKNIATYSGDLMKLVNERLKPIHKNIWLVGGAMLAQQFICLGIADEIRLSVLPIILSGGTRLFDHLENEQFLHLKQVTAYKSGLVEFIYEIKKSKSIEE